MSAVIKVVPKPNLKFGKVTESVEISDINYNHVSANFTVKERDEAAVLVELHNISIPKADLDDWGADENLHKKAFDLIGLAPIYEETKTEEPK